MKLAIELDDRKGYGHIHRSDCRDLRDPETLGEAEYFTSAAKLAEDLTGWGYDDDEWHFAPCTKGLS